MQRAFRLLTAAFLSLSCLTSCSNKGNSANDDTGNGTIIIRIGDVNGCINKDPEYAWDNGPVMSLTVASTADTAKALWQIRAADSTDCIASPVHHGRVPLVAVQSAAAALELVKKDVEYRIMVVRRNGDTGARTFIATGGCGTGDGGFTVTVGDSSGCIGQTPAYTWVGANAALLTVTDTVHADSVRWGLSAVGAVGFAFPVRHGQVPANAVQTHGSLLALDSNVVYQVKVTRTDARIGTAVFLVRGGCGN
jgi:hypothetical protein